MAIDIGTNDMTDQHATPAATTKKLRDTVTEMDSMSQGAFGEISTIARLALASLETPRAYAEIENIATVLSAIWGKAMDAENIINSMAEEVGCNYRDQASQRRSRAMLEAAEEVSHV